MDKGADDETAEGGVGMGVSVGIAVGFLTVCGIFLLPFRTEFGGVHDDCGLVDCLLKSRDGALASRRKRTFIRIFNRISVGATVARAHDNLVGGVDLTRDGIERVGERSACHSKIEL